MLKIIGITRKGSVEVSDAKRRREKLKADQTLKQLRWGGGGDNWSTALFR